MAREVTGSHHSQNSQTSVFKELLVCCALTYEGRDHDRECVYVFDEASVSILDAWRCKVRYTASRTLPWSFTSHTINRDSDRECGHYVEGRASVKRRAKKDM